jgi:AcrR family transcriptional regulator
MDNKIEIQVEKIADPPEKMRLMYEAVSELIREHRELSTIKVSEITAKAGIGKGTAYEYFSSKEELISHALMYEYSNKIQKLAVAAFMPKHFRERCCRVMDWIRDNKEYNLMFSQLFRASRGYVPGAQACKVSSMGMQNDPVGKAWMPDTGAPDIPNSGAARQADGGGCAAPGDFGYEAHRYIYQMIDRFMEDAYKEGVIKETDTGKRSLAFLTAMVEYAFVIMGPQEPRYSHLGEEELRDFIYKSLVRALQN